MSRVPCNRCCSWRKIREQASSPVDTVDTALLVVFTPSADPLLLPLYADLFLDTLARGRGGRRVSDIGAGHKNI